MELDCEIRRNFSFASRNDILSSFLSIFGEYKTFEIKGLYQLNADGSVSVLDKNDKEILSLDAVRKNRTLTIKFQDGTIFDFKKN